MTFEISSHEGVGPVRFGMSPQEVRTALAVPFESFKRTPESAHECDYFPEVQAFVYYTAEGRAEAVEFADPAEPRLNGHNLLKVGFDDLLSLLSEQDSEVVVEPDGLCSKGLGVGAYAPEAEDDPRKPAESVIVFARGYYD